MLANTYVKPPDIAWISKLEAICFIVLTDLKWFRIESGSKCMFVGSAYAAKRKQEKTGNV
jgi:hypothetical protein